MRRAPVSVIVHVLDEMDNIDAVLESVSFGDEIYVVDSFSSDGTVEHIRQRHPRVRLEQRRYLGAASQKNYAMDRAAHDWILVVDADERVGPELREELLRTLAGPLDRWAYSIGRRNYMLGEPLRYGGFRNDRVTRLFHRGHARYPNRRVHAELAVDGDVGRLDAKLDHYCIRTFDHMIAKMTLYADWQSAQMFLDGETTSGAGILGHTAGKFLRDFVLKLGFLDGARGLIAVGMQVYYTFLKYAKLWERLRLERLGRSVPLPELDEDEERWTMPWQRTG